MLPPVRVVVVGHTWIASELGTLGHWLGSLGAQVRRLDRETGLTDAPDAGLSDDPGADLVVLMGSPWSLAEPDDADEVRESQERERALAAAAIDSGTSVLGICYGAQLLTSVLGGTVRRTPEVERGWMRVTTSGVVPAGPWMVWHEDAFEVPSGVEVLARTERATMAFRSNRAWGVQFHPEVDPPILQRMARGLGAPDEVVTEMVDGARRWDAEHRLAARRLFEAFWADAGPAQVRA